MATSSSARKVAKLASRGKGKKVRFSSGTTFPAIVTGAIIAMVLLVAYAKASLPSDQAGPPEPGVEWSIAYGIKVCDTFLPNLTGAVEDLQKDASTGDSEKLNTVGSDADGIIHYHAQPGGNSGNRARLGVFLDIYDIEISDTELVLPESQVETGETRSWDIEDDDVFAGTPCEGEDAVMKVRVWNDFTSDEFFDNVTDFGNLRFKNNGMVFVIAIVPEDAEIAKPDSAARLTELGVIGANSGATTTTTDTSTADTTVDTTAAATTTTTG